MKFFGLSPRRWRFLPLFRSPELWRRARRPGSRRTHRARLSHEPLEGRAMLAAVEGTPLDNDLSSSGTSSNDIIRGLAGNDYIVGQQGDDVLVGGDGADFIRGARIGQNPGGRNTIFAGSETVQTNGVYAEGSDAIARTGDVTAGFQVLFFPLGDDTHYKSIFRDANVIEGGRQGTGPAGSADDVMVASTAKDVFLYQTCTTIDNKVGTDEIHGFRVGQDVLMVVEKRGDGAEASGDHFFFGDAITAALFSQIQGQTGYQASLHGWTWVPGTNSGEGILRYDSQNKAGGVPSPGTDPADNASFAIAFKGLQGTVLTANDFFYRAVPAFQSGTTGSIAENAAVGTVIYAAQATEPDGTPNLGISYAIKSGVGDFDLVEIDATGQVRLTNPADYESKSSYSFTVIASLPITSPALMTLTNERAVAIAVIDVAENQAPTSADKTVSINEDGSYTFLASDFAFADADVGDTLKSVEIQAAPSKGKLQLGVVDLVYTAGKAVIPAADIGKLKYVPVANENGVPYTTFTFKVSDQADAQSAEKTLTVNVVAVNDAPTITLPATPVSTNQDVLKPLTISIDDVDSAQLRLTLLVRKGTVTLKQTTGLTFTSGDGTADAYIVCVGTPGNLTAALTDFTFTPEPGFSGPASIELQVSDGPSGATPPLEAMKVLSITVVDTQAPAATFATVSSPRNAAVGELVITFSEPVTGVGKEDFTLTRGGTALTLTGVTVTGSGTRWVLGGLTSLTGTDGDYELKLTASGSGIKDAAGNEIAVDATRTWTKDAVLPTATPAPVSSSPRNTSVGSVDVTFSEVVTGVTVSDFRLTRNGGLVGLQLATLVQDTLDPKKWTLGNLGGPTTADGAYVLTLIGAGSDILDAASNRLAGNATWSWTMDTVRPTATFAAVPALRNDGLTSIAVTFSEDVTGVDLADFELTLDGGANLLVLPATATQSGKIWTLGNLSTLTSAPGTYVLRLKDGTSVNDTATNGLATGASVSWVVEATVPTLLPTTVSSPRNSSLGSIEVVFSEAVTGVAASAFRLTRGGANVPLTGVTITGSGTTYTLGGLAGLTATDGSYVLTLTGVVKDLAGNAVNVSTPPQVAAWMKTTASVSDTQPPTAIFGPVSSPRNTAVGDVMVTFSEPVTGADSTDFTLTRDGANVPLTGVTVAGSGTQWVVRGLAGLTGLDGDYELTLKGSATGIRDAAGNELAFSTARAWATRVSPFTAGLSAAGAAPLPAAVTTGIGQVVITFSRPIPSLTKASLLLSRGMSAINLGAATLTTADGGTTWTLGNLAGLNSLAGAYTLRLGGSGRAVKDPYGNMLSNAPSASWTVDKVAPSVIAISAPSGNRNTPAGLLRITFSEAVTGVAAVASLTVDGVPVAWPAGAVAPLAGSGDRVWLFDATALAPQADGNYALSLVAGITDLAGNTLLPRALASWTLDTVAPTVEILAITASNNAPLGSVTVVFSEPVTGVDGSDFSLSRDGMTIAEFSRNARITKADASGAQWTIGNLAGLTKLAGTYTLDYINTRTIKDAAGNFVSTASPSVTSRSWTLSSLGATAVATGPAGNEQVEITITFTRAVPRLTVANLVLTRNGVGVSLSRAFVATTDGGFTWRVWNLAPMIQQPGNYELRGALGSFQIRDGLGNALPSATLLAWAKI